MYLEKEKDRLQRRNKENKNKCFSGLTPREQKVKREKCRDMHLEKEPQERPVNGL